MDNLRGWWPRLVRYVLRITTFGTLTTLFTFDYSDGGAEPLTAVIQATDGYFYGTTYTGTGVCTGGTLFGISASGALAQFLSAVNDVGFYGPSH